MAQNWNCYAGELDIVAYKNGLVFVEIKSVKQNSKILPQELFTKRKHRHLLRTINIYLAKNGKNFDKWQLDLICVTKSGCGYKVSHYENVTEW